MNHYGVILKKLRELKKLTIKQAARQIERSAGWISEIENGKGAARLNEIEFERIVKIYDGEPYRKQFGGWITRSKLALTPSKEISFDGSILKYLRTKAKMTLAEASTKVGVSYGHLSDIENGEKGLSDELKNRLMIIYGYSPASFRNFTDQDKRANKIPTQFKLDVLLRKLNESEIEKVFEFVRGQIFIKPKN
ncbi:MAG: transcriptional regulator [Pseudobdellovibrionaceae bacterium]